MQHACQGYFTRIVVKCKKKKHKWIQTSFFRTKENYKLSLQYMLTEYEAFGGIRPFVF